MSLLELSVCRLCCEPYQGAESGILLDHIDKKGRILTDIINQILPVTIGSEKNILPKTICFQCFQQIQSTADFFEHISKGQERLLSLVSRHDNTPKIQDFKYFLNDINNICQVNLTEDATESPKKKRGRPKKEAVTTNVAPSPVHIPIIETDPNKRVRRAPVRYEGVVEGKELEKVLKEEGVFDDESHSDPLQQSMQGIVFGEKEIIGHVETGQGADLAQLSLLGKPNRNSLEFKCETCGEVFTKEKIFLNHQRKHYFICETCHEKYNSKEELDLHQSLTSHTGKENRLLHKCDCGKIVEDPYLLKKHMETDHLKHITCNFCSKKFRFRRCLKAHIKEIHKESGKEGEYICDLCGKVLKHPSSVEYHKQTEHNNERKYVCIKCNKSFKHRQLLMKHQTVHTTLRPFKCANCGAAFKTKVYLTNHMVCHTGEKNFECSICNLKFSHKTSLALHVKMHFGYKPHACDMCDKKFTQKGNLVEHRRIHTGEKPYACTSCDKRFATSSQQKNHMKIHSEVKPHKCEYCHKGFAHHDVYKAHLRRHTGEKPYECSHCNKTFSDPLSLKKHNRIHTGEKPYQCNVCGKKFADSSNLKKHKKVNHVQPANQDTVDLPPVDLWTLIKSEGNKEEDMSSQIYYISYNPNSQTEEKLPENFLKNDEQTIELNTMGAYDKMVPFIDDQGNLLGLTTEEGNTVQLTSVDGNIFQITTSDGNTIPLHLSTEGEELRIPCLTNIVPENDIDQTVSVLDFVNEDNQTVKLLPGLSDASLEFLTCMFK